MPNGGALPIFPGAPGPASLLQPAAAIETALANVLTAPLRIAGLAVPALPPGPATLLLRSTGTTPSQPSREDLTSQTTLAPARSYNI